MSPDLFIALTGFAFVTSATPGPNNLMLMASGANYGFRRTVPHMLGVVIGFTVMVALVGVGLMALFDLFPVAHVVLKYGSILYLLWLAWRIAHAAAPGTGDTGRPMTFFEAAAFQWVNPKGWTMALSAIAAYAPDRGLAAAALVAAVFGLVNLPSVSAWTALGQQIRHVLTSAARLRAYNWTMAALLVATLYPVVFA